MKHQKTIGSICNDPIILSDGDDNDDSDNLDNYNVDSEIL